MNVGFILGFLPRITAGAIALWSKWGEINKDGKITNDEYYSFGLAIFMVFGDIFGLRVPVPETLPDSVGNVATQTKIAINDAINNDSAVVRYAGK